jgi:phage-related protein (TIGR01555 family)
MTDELRNDGALLNAFGSLIGNQSTGLGQVGRDKFLDTAISTIVRPLDRFELHALYRNSKICEKVVELLPKAATSKTWLELTIGKGRKNLPAKALQYANDLGFRDVAREATILARLEGDAFIILGIDDGQLPETPVNESGIRQISWCEVVTRYQLTPEANTGRPGKPEFYRLALPQNQGLGDGFHYGRIHRSRVLRFSGKKLYGDMIAHNSHYHDSVLLAFYQSFIKYLTSVEYSVRMIQDYDTFAYSLKGLGDLILRGKEKEILQRFRAILLSKSSLGGIAMDADEKAEYVSRNFGGIDALIDRMKDDTSAAAGMPPTKLWGSSQKTALSNSSQGDKYEWADCVEDYQAEAIDPQVTEFFRLSLLAQNGATGGRLPDDWGLKYKSVLRLNLKEQVELRSMQTKDVDIPSVQAGFLSQEEIRQSAWGGSDYSIERQLLTTELPKPQGFASAGNTAQGEKLPTDKQAQVDAADIRIDDATPAKRIIDFHGLKLGLQYLPFDQRHGRMLPVAYGHIQKTKGADGMAIDCYLGSNLQSERMFAVAQHINGEFDEDKLMLGFDSIDQAEQMFKQVMPPEFFGGIHEVSLASILFGINKNDAAETLTIEGEVLSEEDYNALSEVDQQDIEAALKDWRQSAPDKFKSLLDS